MGAWTPRPSGVCGPIRALRKDPPDGGPVAAPKALLRKEFDRVAERIVPVVLVAFAGLQEAGAILFAHRFPGRPHLGLGPQLGHRVVLIEPVDVRPGQVVRGVASSAALILRRRATGGRVVLRKRRP